MPIQDDFFQVDALQQGLSRDLAPGMTARIFAGEQAMISVVRIEPGRAGEVHAHPQEQWGLCLRGSGVRIQGDREIAVGAGDFWRTPGGVAHGFRAGPDGAVIYDVFAPPREEYRAGGSGFGQG